MKSKVVKQYQNLMLLVSTFLISVIKSNEVLYLGMKVVIYFHDDVDLGHVIVTNQ
jgi:hypothetical protein